MLSLGLRHRSPISTLFPYTTLFRSKAPLVHDPQAAGGAVRRIGGEGDPVAKGAQGAGRESDELVARELVAVDVERRRVDRSEEHTSELQSRFDLVCRLLLEKKKRSH